MATAASAEFHTLQKNRSTICDVVANCTNIAWFADRVGESGFIDMDVKDSIVHTLGHNNYNKCSQLLIAVEAQVRADPSKYHTFNNILKESVALHSVVVVLSESYALHSRKKPYLQLQASQGSDGSSPENVDISISEFDREFALLISDLAVMLQNAEGSLCRMQTTLETLAQRLPLKKFVHVIRSEEYGRAQTVKNFFRLLSPYFSSIDHTLLRTLVDATHCQQAIERLETFLKKATDAVIVQKGDSKSVHTQETTRESDRVESSYPSANTVIVEVKGEGDQLRLRDYSWWTALIAGIWRLPTLALSYFSSGSGCVAVRWEMDADLLPHILSARMSDHHFQLLAQQGMIHISIGSHLSISVPDLDYWRLEDSDGGAESTDELSATQEAIAEEALSSLKPTPVPEQTTSGKPAIPSLQTTATPMAEQATTEKPDPRAFLMACKDGDEKKVVNLIMQGVDVNSRDDLGQTGLHLASEEGHSKVVENLISHGAELNLLDSDGFTPLMLACYKNHPETVEVLVGGGAALDIQGQNGYTALNLASRYSHPETVHILTEAGAALDIQDNEGWSPLMAASRYGHPKSAQVLVEAGAALDIQNQQQWTALMIASRYGSPESVHALVSAGAALDIQDKAGETALMHATYENKTETVKILVEAGAALDIQKDNGWTALMDAARYGHHEIVQTLVAARAALNMQQKYGWTALMLATSGGHLLIVQILTSAGAALDLQEEEGLTALMTAVNGGHVEIVQELTRAGANPDIQDKDGLTALMLATKKANITIVECLLQSRASPDIAEKTTGWTALFFAAKDGNTEIVRLLVKSGCDTNAKDNNEITPLDIARTHSRGEVCEELRKTTPRVDRAPLSESTLKRLIKTDNFFRILFKRLEERMQQIAHPEKFKKEALSQWIEEQALSIDSSHPL